MKTSKILFLSALVSAMPAMAQNQANVTLRSGEVDTYKTAEILSIDFNDETVTINPVTGNPVIYSGNVASLSFIKNHAGHVAVTEAAGWLEAAYIKWEPMQGATSYNVYVRDANSEYAPVDPELIRRYAAYGRCDVPGLRAGMYDMKVVPVVDGVENEDAATEALGLDVRAHNRGGFAHYNYPDGVGAYNNDGTLKEGAKVFYVTANTAKTIQTDVITSSKGNTTSCTGFQTILDAYMKGYDHTPICFRIIGRVTRDDLDKYSSSAEGLQIKNNRPSNGGMNITIEGIGNDACFHGFGVLLRAAESVEISNLGLLWFMDDGISCDTDNSHCWIHNCDFFYGQKGGDSDQAKGDGSLDVKGDSQYMTFSYNRFWDAGKSSLCGLSESGPNYLTYHHNWYDHSDSRHPRIRTMSVHIYNNYFDGCAKYGVGSTLGSDVFVESNYFRDCKYPVLTSKQGSDIATDSKGTFSSEDGGSIKLFGNIMRGKYYFRPYSETNTVEFDGWVAPTRDAQMPSTITAKQGGDTYSNWDTNASLMYEYTADDAADVPAIVTGVYGAGRCNHGDLHWTFNNNIQDENYDVINDLSNTIRDYDSWLVGYYDGTVIGNGGQGFTNPGGDSTSGDEFPFGDYNRAEGGSGSGSGDQPSEVDPNDYFICAADGSWFRFDSSASAQVAAWEADGTLTGGTYAPNFNNADYAADITGAYQLVKNGGQCIIKCPSVSVFKAQLLRTGSYSGKVEKSSDGVNWTECGSLSGSKGVMEVDWSAALASDAVTYIRITNNSTGSLNILGLVVVK